MSLVTTLLSHADADCDNLGVKKRSEIIYRCIHRALWRRDSPLAVKLLFWHVQHLGRHFGSLSSLLIEDAIRVDDLLFVQVMHTSG